MTLEHRIAAVWELLDRGDTTAALDLAERLARENKQRPEAHLALAMAAFYADLPEASSQAANRVLTLVEDEGVPDKTDAAGAARLALARNAFRLWDFETAETRVREALRRDADNPEGWDLLAQVLEHTGRWSEAAAADRRAEQADPDAFPVPNRISDDDMEQAVQEAIDELPESLRELAQEAPVILETFPSREMAAPPVPGMLPLAPDILGLFIGTPRSEQSLFTVADTPNAIFLFKGNLERMCPDRESLIDEIVVTLHHELAHYLGFEEGAMPGLGLE
jgi:predicted Zn-dependent protease with MMP-like domain